MTDTRRRFTDDEKLKILEEADKAQKEGKSIPEVAEMYSLYTSAIYEWRRARAAGKLKPTKTNGVKEEKTKAIGDAVTEGPVPVATPSQTVREEMLLLRVQELEDALSIAMKKAERAETLLRLHKQVAELEAEMMAG